MNTFASVVLYMRLDRVSYYTIQIEDGSQSEIAKFWKKSKNWEEHKQEVSRLASWIKQIGERGATSTYFRDENKADALPPKGIGRKIGKSPNGTVRLYCYWVSEQIVILFNGDIKTTDSAQDCPRVAPFFRQANGWVRKLKEIGIEHDGQDITNLEDLNFPV